MPLLARSIPARIVWPALVTVIVAGWTVIACRGDEPAADQQKTSHSKSADDVEARLQKEFRKQIFPLLTDSEQGCVDCHSTEGTSALILSGNARDDFRLLLDQQYLRLKGADTLLNRLTTAHVERRMPKEAQAWTPQQVEQLKRFLQSVKELEDASGLAVDEQFPRSLTSKYRGEQHTATDNQFLTYRQLRGKIRVLFEDEWQRDGRDLFAENVAMFGGADFKTRFDESSQPSASFLTALETMARDVATLAYDERRGPFADWPGPERRPADPASDSSTRAGIQHLYEHLLYRPPTEAEVQESLALLASVFALEDTIAQRNDELKFELTVTEPQTGLTRKEQIRIPVSGDLLAVGQRLIDQAAAEAKSSSKLQRQTVARGVWLEPGADGQRLVLHNLGTVRNVSFAGVELRDLNTDQLLLAIEADSPSVEVEGAWQLSEDDGFKSYEDRNQHKGQSSIRVPLTVDKAAEVDIVLKWRSDDHNATNVLVEWFSRRGDNRLADPPPSPTPPKGQAQFAYDSSDDTVAFFAPPAIFRFDDQGNVRISNDGTLDQVTAGAVQFSQSDDDEQSFLIDSLEAEGHENWARFDEGRFKAYNVKGAKLHDDNKNKGERELVYRPQQKRDDGWQSDRFYDLKVFYPGKRDQECQVPVTITATESSPIVQIAYPRLAKADARVRLDASGSYTVQGSPLVFAWRQTGGTRVKLTDSAAPVLEFIAPRRRVEQAAWTSLCAALIRHPDFLFTRPTSLFHTSDTAVKRRLQLVKLALDLVGRPPTRQEVQALTDGRTLAEMTDRYLASDEFRDFYFHRIRLYLESQGTEAQDEPARLWCYVAFNGRPFQEILTADYTVDVQLQKVERPAYHGRTGVLTTAGFIQGKPGLPHYNYAAQVSMLFLGFVYEVPPEIVELREGVTALGTTDPNSVCYSCHKILTPLAFQRSNWTDEGEFRIKNEHGLPIDASDHGVSEDYPFPGEGLEAFATQAVRKERFIRTMINTHVNFYFGRPLRYREDERDLYRRLWNQTKATDYKIIELVRAIVTSPEYLEGRSIPSGPHR